MRDQPTMWQSVGIVACALWLLTGAGARAQESTALGPRIASYSIDATLDPAARTLAGRETITWRNAGGIPAYSIRLHLYWNAWRNTDSTWLAQQNLGDLDEDLGERQPADFGWQQVTELRLANPDGTSGADLLPSFRYISPSDQNRADRSLAAADLPAGVAPGETIRLIVAWRAQVPRTFARTGAIGRYFFMAHWFPKLGVFEGDGWTARQFFANTEFYADFGSYDVRLTVPRGWIVGATGRQVSRTDAADEATVHRYAQGDVHDFAWTTSPDFVEHESRFEHPSLPPVTMRLLLQPEHRGQEDRHFAAAAAALKYYGEWFGAYPYPQLTIVDPAWQSESGGMEYPTLITAGTRWLAPRQTTEPEGVTVHEAGHQFWYGLVANDEVTAAWMDEGINTYSEARVIAEAFSPDFLVDRFFGDFIPWQYRDIPRSRATDGNLLGSYRGAPSRDALINPTYGFWPATAWITTYAKTALMMHTLERMLGWDRLRQAMATYFQRFRFKHPRADDFFTTLNQETGEDLTWFFEQAYATSGVFDYAADRLASEPVSLRGFVEATPGAAPTFEDTADQARFRTTVVVRRLGEARFPVDMLVTFENGEQVREKWDGQARWQTYLYDKASKAVSVQVDPDRVLLLDINYTNNSMTSRPRAAEAADRWTLTWVVWLQDMLMNYAFFV